MEPTTFQADFRSMFLEALRNALEFPLCDHVVAGLPRRVAAFSERAERSLAPPRHIETCAYFAATYQALCEVENDGAFERLHRLIDLYGEEATRCTRRMLDEASAPFRRLVDESKSREADDFGSSPHNHRPWP